MPLCAPFAEVSGVSIPAREVGGDFFNYFVAAGEDEVAILIGDVSGKGVGAALLMASLQATIRARLALERDLACLVDALDREMDSEEPLAPYYTLFLAVLDGRERARCATSTPGTTRSSCCAPTASSSGSPRPAGRPGLYPGGGYEERSAACCGRATRSSSSPTGWSRPRTSRASRSASRGSRRCCGCTRRRASGRCSAAVHAAVRAHRGPLEAADDATMVALRYSRRRARGRRRVKRDLAALAAREHDLSWSWAAASTAPPRPGTRRSAGSRWRSSSATTSAPARPGTA